MQPLYLANFFDKIWTNLGD